MKRSDQKIDPGRHPFIFITILVLLGRGLAMPMADLGIDASADLIHFVNPFIGTANGGNTFPGAVRPWGMVSLSPHNAPALPSGYRMGEEYFYGFGCVHLSGTGCADLGSVIIVVSRGQIRTDPDEYRCTYSKETAEPGFYRVRLNEPETAVEVSASNRSGFMVIAPESEGELNVLFDVGRNLSRIGGGAITICSKQEVAGYNNAGGFCGEANRHRVYFVAQFNLPATASGIWVGKQLRDDQQIELAASEMGSWFRFRTRANQSLRIKIGISYLSIENARENLTAEIPHWDFDKVRQEARQAWQKELSRIRVEGGRDEDKVKFYSALYHTLLHPNIISDINGEYPLAEPKGIGHNPDRDRYSVFSLWDTYRTLHPLLTLVFPERQSAMIKTMLDFYAETGYLPKWELISNETYMMVGDPAGPVIADSYLKGITDFDIQTAYLALRKAVFLSAGEKAPPIRAGYHEYLKYNYIPFEQDTSEAWWVWGPVSTTLEYCYADWTLAQLAQKLGKSSDAEDLIRRSGYYKNLFDPKTQFIRPKLKNGMWLMPFDPLQTEGSGSWSGSGGPGYVEGNAWSYTWFVPHDVGGLIRLFGGPEKFAKKLNQCFEIGQFSMSNEPDIAYPYLFTYLPGQEYRTRQIIRTIINNDFKDSPDGLPGNDDCGTISAWMVFSALGFYPVCPAAAEYQIGIPLFNKAEIHLDKRYYKGRKFIIEAPERRPKGKEPKILVNGEAITNFQIRHDQIVAGGTLQFMF